MPRKLTFYPLVSRNIFTLKRHLEVSKIPKDQVMFVINTLDKEFEEYAVNYCKEENVAYTVTESNGTASRGKNCFLEVFENSDSDYAVLIDGDDYLTPYGVDMYKMLAEDHPAPPDVVCLYNQFVKVPTEFTDKFVDINPDYLDYNNSRFFTFEDWDKAISGEHLKPVLERSASEEKIEELTNLHRKLMLLLKGAVEMEESHCRVTFISRNVIPFKFNENFKVGEDTLNYFDLKNAAMKGELVMVRNNELTPTYIYDMRISGIAAPACQDVDHYLAWAEPFAKEVIKYEEEGKLHKNGLLELKLDYPQYYRPEYAQEDSHDPFYFSIEMPTMKGDMVEARSYVPVNSSDLTILKNAVVQV